uniref:Glycosyl hydrolase family 57 n=1 Tax=Candidatus Kentrum sp. FM TaxID=2126340 RepID=A0A450RYT0_9GAMM|nr:MAG: Glycosyl hydrolase family 57 [Candidatus Kentron sp. FM]VFJ50174.1 MAG: Glycosyl hydrolase family 57 [Candidatus Kentron sp. FM]VFK06594.1 MAG: Glycosyl hydrolase family 57 [Candidatus Kentron sp. FM]
MKYVSFLFHIYQPPIQDPRIIREIVNESYLPLTQAIRDFPDLHFTMNINLSLVEHLYEFAPQVLTNIRAAYEQGNLELTNSGAYHPIFPLLPREEVIRQLELNEQGIRKLLPIDEFRPKGVFPPEMAFEYQLASLFAKQGYEWTITDDTSVAWQQIPIPSNKIYQCEGVSVFLRSNYWSNRFANNRMPDSGKGCVDELARSLADWQGDGDGYVIIALDGETFGHHHEQLGAPFLHDLFQAFRDNPRPIQLAHLTEINGLFPHVSQFIPPASWSMDEKNIEARDYFPLWKSHGNRIHALQWQFTHCVLKKVRRLQTNKEINREMDRALFSCQYWWASFWRFEPREIYKGAFNMMAILQHVGELLGDNYRQIEEGEEIFRELVTEVEKERIEREGK